MTIDIVCFKDHFAPPVEDLQTVLHHPIVDGEEEIVVEDIIIEEEEETIVEEETPVEEQSLEEEESTPEEQGEDESKEEAPADENKTPIKKSKEEMKIKLLAFLRSFSYKPGRIKFQNSQIIKGKAIMNPTVMDVQICTLNCSPIAKL